MRPRLLFMLLLLWLATPLASVHARLTLGAAPEATPELPSVEHAERLAAALGKALGEEIELRVFNSREELDQWLLKFTMLDLAIYDAAFLAERPGKYLVIGAADDAGKLFLTSRQGVAGDLPQRVAKALQQPLALAKGTTPAKTGKKVPQEKPVKAKSVAQTASPQPPAPPATPAPAQPVQPLATPLSEHQVPLRKPESAPATAVKVEATATAATPELPPVPVEPPGKMPPPAPPAALAKPEPAPAAPPAPEPAVAPAPAAPVAKPEEPSPAKQPQPVAAKSYRGEPPPVAPPPPLVFPELPVTLETPLPSLAGIGQAPPVVAEELPKPAQPIKPVAPVTPPPPPMPAQPKVAAPATPPVVETPMVAAAPVKLEEPVKVAVPTSEPAKPVEEVKPAEAAKPELKEPVETVKPPKRVKPVTPVAPPPPPTPAETEVAAKAPAAPPVVEAPKVAESTVETEEPVRVAVPEPESVKKAEEVKPAEVAIPVPPPVVEPPAKPEESPAIAGTQAKTAVPVPLAVDAPVKTVSVARPEPAGVAATPPPSEQAATEAQIADAVPNVIAQPDIPQELRPPGVPVVRPTKLPMPLPPKEEDKILAAKLPEKIGRTQKKAPLLPPPDPEPGIVYVVPFITLMVPEAVRERIFDQFVDKLNASGANRKLHFVILKEPLEKIDREWLDARKYVFGEIFGYVEESGCCSTDLRAKARLTYYRAHHPEPSLRYEFPIRTFFEHNQTTIEAERNRVADQIANALVAELTKALQQ